MIQRTQLEAMEDGVIESGSTALLSLLEENQRLSRLVADLEVLGSAEAARFSLRRRPVDLAQPVHAAAAGFSSLLEEKGVALSVDVQPVGADADPERVGQIVANLPSNALKHTRRGDTVSLRLQQAGPWAMIEVADSGRGISQDDLPRVFERFYRGRRPRGRGSGIGLAVVRELAEAHGGRAMIESPAGSGAVFRVVIPALPTGGLTGFTSDAQPAVVTSSTGGRARRR